MKCKIKKKKNVINYVACYWAIPNIILIRNNISEKYVITTHRNSVHTVKYDYFYEYNLRYGRRAEFRNNYVNINVFDFQFQ